MKLYFLTRGSPEEERDLTHVAQSVAEIRDVFGDSDEEEPADYGVQHDMEQVRF